LIEKVVGSVDGFTELLANIGGLSGLARTEEKDRVLLQECGEVEGAGDIAVHEECLLVWHLS
jgi:hypothetical protein